MFMKIIIILSIARRRNFVEICSQFFPYMSFVVHHHQRRWTTTTTTTATPTIRCCVTVCNVRVIRSLVLNENNIIFIHFISTVDDGRPKKRRVCRGVVGCRASEAKFGTFGWLGEKQKPDRGGGSIISPSIVYIDWKKRADVGGRCRNWTKLTKTYRSFVRRSARRSRSHERVRSILSILRGFCVLFSLILSFPVVVCLFRRLTDGRSVVQRCASRRVRSFVVSFPLFSRSILTFQFFAIRHLRNATKEFFCSFRLDTDRQP